MLDGTVVEEGFGDGVVRNGGSADGRALIYIDGGVFMLADLTTGLRTVLGRGERDEQVAWSPTGERFAITRSILYSGARLAREVVVFDSDGTEEKTVGLAFNLVRLAWSPDGSWLAVRSVLLLA